MSPASGSALSDGSWICIPITSCLRAAIRKVSSNGVAIKSLRINAMHFFLMTLDRYSSGALISVFFPFGSKKRISLMILSKCCLPFLGGIYNSVLSVKRISPTLSLFCNAENPRTAQSSAIHSFFHWSPVPK